MGKRLLFLVLLIPFLVLIIGILIASLFKWIFTGRDYLYLIDVYRKKLEELI
jgi:hypothetical protein